VHNQWRGAAQICSFNFQRTLSVAGRCLEICLMRKIILLLTSLVIFISCSNQKEIEISSVPIRTVVTGKVINPISDEPTISLWVNRVGFEPEEIKVLLDSTGNFKTYFLTYVPVDVWVSYHINFLVLLKPGDSLYVEFDATRKSRPELLETVKFEGSAGENNRQASIFQKMYYANDLYVYEHDEPYHRVENAYKNYEPDRFKIFADSMRQEGIQFLDDYIRQYKPNEFVKSWATFAINKDYYDYMSFYPNSHRKANVLKQNEWSVPIAYYDYFKEPYALEEGLHSGYAIGGYLNRYRSYIYALVRDKLKGYTPEKSKQLWDSLALNSIVANTQSNSLREATLTYEFLSYLLNSDIETFERYKYLAEENIHSEFLREPLFEKYETIKKKVEGQIANRYSKVESLDKLMGGIISNNKGKVTYVDIWATWCAPCREEFPYSKKLQQAFSDDKVSFVFICIESKENSYENTLKQLQLGGTHYFLNEEQSAELREALEIDGIPRYVLIDKNGKMVSEEYRPSDDATKGQIEKLVKG
jgi:thiol-disulfide isomerase/thioredoxin